MIFFLYITILISLAPKHHMEQLHQVGVLEEAVSQVETLDTTVNQESLQSLIGSMESQESEKIMEIAYSSINSMFKEYIKKARRDYIALGKAAICPVSEEKIISIMDKQFTCQMLQVTLDRYIFRIGDVVCICHIGLQYDWVSSSVDKTLRFEENAFLTTPFKVLKKGDVSYALFPYIEGKDIESLKDKFSKYDEKEQKKIFLSFLIGLEDLTSKKLFHNDLRGQNIIISTDNISHIIDFEFINKKTRNEMVQSSSGKMLDLSLVHSDWAHVEKTLSYFSSEWTTGFAQEFSLNRKRLAGYLTKETYATSSNSIENLLMEIDAEPLTKYDKSVIHFHKKLKKMIAWEGFQETLAELSPSISQKQLRRLQSRSPLSVTQILRKLSSFSIRKHLHSFSSLFRRNRRANVSNPLEEVQDSEISGVQSSNDSLIGEGAKSADTSFQGVANQRDELPVPQEVLLIKEQGVNQNDKPVVSQEVLAVSEVDADQNDTPVVSQESAVISELKLEKSEVTSFLMLGLSYEERTPLTQDEKIKLFQDFQKYHLALTVPLNWGDQKIEITIVRKGESTPQSLAYNVYDEKTKQAKVYLDERVYHAINELKVDETQRGTLKQLIMENEMRQLKMKKEAHLKGKPLSAKKVDDQMSDIDYLEAISFLQTMCANGPEQFDLNKTLFEKFLQVVIVDESEGAQKERVAFEKIKEYLDLVGYTLVQKDFSQVESFDKAKQMLRDVIREVSATRDEEVKSQKALQEMESAIQVLTAA